MWFGRTRRQEVVRLFEAQGAMGPALEFIEIYRKKQKNRYREREDRERQIGRTEKERENEQRRKDIDTYREAGESNRKKNRQINGKEKATLNAED